MIAPNYGELGKKFGKDTQRVAKLIVEHQPSDVMTIDGFTILPEHVVIKESAPEGYAQAQYSEGAVYLKTEATPELIEEGFVRELTRRVQALRKDLGLVKKDTIELHIGGVHHISAHHLAELAKKTNASLVTKHVGEERVEHIRDRTYALSVRKVL